MRIPILQIRSISKSFGTISALSEVSMTVMQGEIVGIIGPNGSGKTTLFNVVSRHISPDQGSVRFFGRNLTDLEPFEIAHLGVSRTFQKPQICSQLTVRENVAVAAFSTEPASPFHSSRAWRKEESKRVDLVLQRLDLLAERHMYPAALSHFGLRKAELARALVNSPKLVMLDEPTSGLTQTERDFFRKTMKELRREGVSVLIIEHNLGLLRHVCDRIVVLDVGRKVLEDDPESIACSKKLAEIYIGVSDAKGR